MLANAHKHQEKIMNMRLPKRTKVIIYNFVGGFELLILLAFLFVYIPIIILISFAGQKNKSSLDEPMMDSPYN